MGRIAQHGANRVSMPSVYRSAGTVSADVYMHGRWPLMMAGTDPRGYGHDGMTR